MPVPVPEVPPVAGVVVGQPPAPVPELPDDPEVPDAPLEPATEPPAPVAPAAGLLPSTVFEHEARSKTRKGADRPSNLCRPLALDEALIRWIFPCSARVGGRQRSPLGPPLKMLLRRNCNQLLLSHQVRFLPPTWAYSRCTFTSDGIYRVHRHGVPERLDISVS